MARSYKAKPSATGRFRSAKGQATAKAAAVRKGNPAKPGSIAKKVAAKKAAPRRAATKLRPVAKSANRKTIATRRSYRDSR